MSREVGVDIMGAFDTADELITLEQRFCMFILNEMGDFFLAEAFLETCLLYTSPSPRDS